MRAGRWTVKSPARAHRTRRFAAVSSAGTARLTSLIQHLLAVAIDCRNGVFAGTNDLVKTIGGSDPLDIGAS